MATSESKNSRTEAILKVKKLSVRFPRDDGGVSWVVRDASLDIMPSEIFGITGESGSGKTMFVLTIMGLLPENARVEGSIFFGKTDLLSISDQELREIRGNRISMIFQDPTAAFNPTLKVGYQVAEPYIIHKGEKARQAIKHSAELLRHVRISDPSRRILQRPFELSGGMLQRAMIASAVSLRPDILIADEPTTGLDVTIQAGVLQLFKEMRRELRAAILLITHDLAVVAETCDRVAVMYAGEIVEIGKVSEVIGDPKHPYTHSLLRCTPDVDRPPGNLEKIPGTLPGPEDQRPVCRFFERCPFGKEKCEETITGHPDLVEIGYGRRVRCWLASKGIL
jgi:peptide/nickel transport system ATP-binding protein/oligopeptide transport system ATP-binding protein